MSELSGFAKLVERTTPEQMLQDFPDLEVLETRPDSSNSSSSAKNNDEKVFEGHDEEQIRLMNEACICVDWHDQPYAAGSKKTCHLEKDIDKGLLHRAFSVFLFNKDNKLLLQKRASEKITFADLWTNTCCSHPLAVSAEMGSGLDTAVVGVKNAAIRKLDHELGIRAQDVPFDDFHFLTRIHYRAPSNEVWGEHEIDYILFIRADPELDPSPNEVGDWRWVSADELKQFFDDPSAQFTPWFKLICDRFLFSWWDQLDALPAGNSEIVRML